MVHVAARSSGIKPTNNDILLQAVQRVDLAIDRRFREDTRCLLKEAAEMKDLVCKRRLGDALQNRRRSRDLAAVRLGPIVDLLELLPVDLFASQEDRVARITISTFCNICRTTTSMCLSLIFTPCSR